MNKMMKDRNGYAPEATPQCDTHDDCLGWVLCHHPIDQREAGWCGACDEGVDDEPGGRDGVWMWCPERIN